MVSGLWVHAEPGIFLGESTMYPTSDDIILLLLIEDFLSRHDYTYIPYEEGVTTNPITKAIHNWFVGFYEAWWYRVEDFNEPEIADWFGTRRDGLVDILERMPTISRYHPYVIEGRKLRP
jgi:hypothetical protein